MVHVGLSPNEIWPPCHNAATASGFPSKQARNGNTETTLFGCLVMFSFGWEVPNNCFFLDVFGAKPAWTPPPPQKVSLLVERGNDNALKRKAKPGNAYQCLPNHSSPHNPMNNVELQLAAHICIGGSIKIHFSVSPAPLVFFHYVLAATGLCASLLGCTGVVLFIA